MCENHMIRPHADDDPVMLTPGESQFQDRIDYLEKEVRELIHERDALQSRVDDLEGALKDLLAAVSPPQYNYKHCPSCTSKLTVLKTCPNEDCHVYEQIPQMLARQAD